MPEASSRSFKPCVALLTRSSTSSSHALAGVLFFWFFGEPSCFSFVAQSTTRHASGTFSFQGPYCTAPISVWILHRFDSSATPVHFASGVSGFLRGRPPRRAAGSPLAFAMHVVWNPRPVIGKPTGSQRGQHAPKSEHTSEPSHEAPSVIQATQATKNYPTPAQVARSILHLGFPIPNRGPV